MMNRTAPFLTASTLGVALAVASSAALAEGLVVPKAEPTANAESASVPAPPSNWMNYNLRPLTASKGMLAIHGDLVANVSTNAGGKPVWITPNVFYGVSDQLSVGIAENPQADFLPTQGGFCLGSIPYCGKVLNYLGPTAIYSFTRTDTMEVAGHAGLDFVFSPSQLGARVGALMKFGINSQLALMADPTIGVGITQRTARNNKEAIFVPVRVGFQANPQLNAGLIVGVNGPVDGNSSFADFYAIPVGVNALFSPNDKVDMGLNFTFTNLAGHHDRGIGALDGRTIALTVNYRL